MKSRYALHLTLLLGSVFLLSFRCGNDYKNNSTSVISGVLVDEASNPLPNFELYLAHDYPADIRNSYINQRIIKTDYLGRFSFLSPEPIHNSGSGASPMLKFIDTTWHKQYDGAWESYSGPYIVLPLANETNKIEVGIQQIFQP